MSLQADHQQVNDNLQYQFTEKMYQSDHQNNQLVKEEPINSPHQQPNHYLVYGNELVYNNHIDHRNWLMAQFHHQQQHHYPHSSFQPTSSFEPVSDHKYDPHYTYNNAPDSSGSPSTPSIASSPQQQVTSPQTPDSPQQPAVTSQSTVMSSQRQYKPCFVCGDKSSGYHYGVSSCEGCKGFFRRSIQKNAAYSCHRKGDCPITKETRSRCQFCRLQKCLKVGMLRESVRNHRQRRRGKEKKRMDEKRQYVESLDPEQLLNIFPQDPLPDKLQNLVDVITSSHINTSPSLKELRRFRILKEEPLKMSTDVSLWKMFSQRSTLCIEKIVMFAKSIPGFLQFNIHDQITLIKSASMDVLVLRLCSRYDVKEDSMTLSDGLTLNRCQMHNCGFGPITNVVYDFAKKLLEMQIDETEIGLLSALSIITSADHKDLEEAHLVQEHQEPLIEALRIYSRKRRPDHPLIYPQLIMKLYDLRKLSISGSSRAKSVHGEIPRDDFPPLITELLLRED